MNYWRRGEGKLGGELSRFVSTTEQELENNRGILSIMRNYKKNTGKEFVNELEILTTDMYSPSYEAALTRFETRINSPVLPGMVRGLIDVLRGDDGAMYFQILSHDFKQMGLQRLKREAQEIPFKIRVFSPLILVCFTVTYLAIIIFEILKPMGGMSQKRRKRRRRDMSSAKNQTGMTEREVENGNGQKLSGTVRELLERHLKGPILITMPSGYVYLVPEQIGNLLAGETVSGNPYGWRGYVQTKAKELLQQMVDSVSHVNGTWYMLARLYEPETIPARTNEEGMMCHV